MRRAWPSSLRTGMLRARTRSRGRSSRCRCSSQTPAASSSSTTPCRGSCPTLSSAPRTAVKLADPKRPIQDVTKDLVGTSISVKVSEVNEEERKLVFSEKDASWLTYSSQIKIGDIYDGIVSSVFHYGAFVHLRFPDGLYHLTGLVHISEVSWDLVQDVQDFLNEGDAVKVIVINIDMDKSRIALSIRQLEEDPLLETLDKVIPLEADQSPDRIMSPSEVELLPGLDGICNELLQEDGITDVQFGRQALEKRVVSQDLELWLSNVPAKDNKFTLLARAGRQVQEVYLTTSLDQEGIKKAVQRVLGRVP
ncbi:unnamed protein product [Urochloa decumbens]|uniref:S1 motif domain-containing protein n=1 Tax=Urochloa decumbens TaxID=240449 RepID=A0ABC8X505_9POAL